MPPLINGQAQARRSDGHIADVAILHIGFLGTRHTALVSADDRGMAFSHLATRGMGAVGRVVRTTRILGRYPELITRTSKPPRPSSVLAFSPLPLGNVEQATDSMGLAAMLTPYLLVIVSTTPVAQTQYKTNRPKEVAAHSAMSAALAWFPSIKLKAKEEVSDTKLVYCWSNILSVLEVSDITTVESSEKEKPPEFRFRTSARWKAEEAIVAVQWLSRSVLVVLTISQQLLILEEATMKLTDSLDLVQRHIYHHDLFSRQLHMLIESLDENDESMHGVVADAFYMSFRTYKGRLFVLGHNDMSIGTLTNWADRLLAMIEAGDFIGAIQIATSYYNGHGEKRTIGLPEDDRSRHSVVQEKLLEMITASVKYAFGRNPEADQGQIAISQLTELAEVCVIACDSMDNHDFLFEEVFTFYEDNGRESIFLDVLEPYIVGGKITSLPPTAVKALIEHYVTNHSPSSLEEIICQLNPLTMDIEQVTRLCRAYNLYDAFIYVWTRTLEDFASPLKELLTMSSEKMQPNGNVEQPANRHDNAIKMFPYMSYTLTGRVYPTGEIMDDSVASKAKFQIYEMLFFSSPESDKQRDSSASKNGATTSQPSFSHLSAILRFDSASFMSVLNEAFEDSFLNDTAAQQGSSTSTVGKVNDEVRRQSINRQYLVNVLLRTMNTEDFGAEDAIYLDMFLARSLPKYPQYVILPGTILHQTLTRLCHPPIDDIAEDCQLSVEYLLSVYHPTDIQELVLLLKKARFYRVLKSVYRSEQLYGDWIETFFLDDQNQEEIFDAIKDCLRDGSVLTLKQKRNVRTVTSEHIDDLLLIDVTQTASMIDAVAEDMHQLFVESLKRNPRSQYEYLGIFVGHMQGVVKEPTDRETSSNLTELYIRLMCQFEPSRVADFVDTIIVGGLQIDPLLTSMEEGGIVDAAVVLLAREGRAKDAMDRLTRHLSTLEAALLGLLENAEQSPDQESMGETIHDILKSMEKYTRVGIWLCKGQTKSAPRTRVLRPAKGASAAKDEQTTFEEGLWLSLINAVVNISRVISPNLTQHINTSSIQTAPLEDQRHHMVASTTTPLRALVQAVFTALLAATTTSRDGPSTSSGPVSFLRILRAFLTHAASVSPTLSELRAVLASIFTAYAYEESLLDLANSMLDRDLFVNVEENAKGMQRGWRPRGQGCEICRGRVWGPGVGGRVWDEWVKREKRRRSIDARDDWNGEKGKEKGKETAFAAKAEEDPQAVDDEDGSDERGDKNSTLGSPQFGPAVVFSCRHLYHQACLLERQREDREGEGAASASGAPPSSGGRERLDLICPVCTVHESLNS